jgi:hypothetical protein
VTVVQGSTHERVRARTWDSGGVLVSDAEWRWWLLLHAAVVVMVLVVVEARQNSEFNKKIDLSRWLHKPTIII